MYLSYVYSASSMHMYVHCSSPQDDMIQFGRHVKMCRFVLTLIMKLCQVRWSSGVYSIRAFLCMLRNLDFYCISV